MMKQFLLSTLVLALSACGFTPVHEAANIGETTAFENIKVVLDEPRRLSNQEAGYHVQQHLRDRLGSNNGRHTLTISPSTTRGQFGLTSSDIATRYDMKISVGYILTDSLSGEILYEGRARANSIFGSSGDPYTRISAERTATDQVAREAADRILIRLASYYKDPDRAVREREEREQARLDAIMEAIRARAAGETPVPVESIDPVDPFDPEIP